MFSATREICIVEITPELTLRDLDRCRVLVWCEDECREGTMISVTGLIAKYGIDAKVTNLVPRFYCRRCKVRRGRVEIERQIGIYRPVGHQPYYF